MVGRGVQAVDIGGRAEAGGGGGAGGGGVLANQGAGGGRRASRASPPPTIRYCRNRGAGPRIGGSNCRVDRSGIHATAACGRIRNSTPPCTPRRISGWFREA